MSKHKKISLVKSGFRVVGCVLGMFVTWEDSLFMHVFAFFLVAEGLGIWEEWNEK